jgi:hypothetical protein
VLEQLINGVGKRVYLIVGTSFSLSLVVSTIALIMSGRAASDPVLAANQLNAPFVWPQSSIGAAAIRDCDDYYFRRASVNVGSDGLQLVADRTAPIADTAVFTSATLNSDTEIARFYSNPPLTDTWQLSEAITGVIWVTTSRSTTTTLNIQMFDYDPGNGVKAPLGDFPLTLLSEGETTIEFNISPPVASIGAGHRLLFVLQGKKGSPPSKVD